MINLNLGSGSNRRQDYISVDLYDKAADLRLDITKTLPFDNDSVDNIYACHVIEHLSREELSNCLPDWVRILRPGGAIEIRCPDIVKVCEQMISDPASLTNHQRLYGLQNSPGEYHKSGHTQQSLTIDLMGLDAEVLAPSSDYELHMRFTK